MGLSFRGREAPKRSIIEKGTVAFLGFKNTCVYDEAGLVQ